MFGAEWDVLNYNVYIWNPAILGGGILGNLNYNSDLPTL